MDAAMRFAALVSGPPTELRLDRACALMAEAFTGIDASNAIANELDGLADLCVVPSLHGVLATLRGRLTGNRSDYYDARNSYLGDVLTRGLGLPITLSVVAIEVGRRAGVAVEGVGLPGHFIVREQGHDVFGDPFNNGAIFDRAGLIEAWDGLTGGDQRFDEAFLAPVSERNILIRMLNNLRMIVLPKADAAQMYSLAVMRGGFSELAHEGAEHARWVRSLN
jgi:regulator of sirC expression with transglutaminase-like and TPR domain